MGIAYLRQVPITLWPREILLPGKSNKGTEFGCGSVSCSLAFSPLAFILVGKIHAPMRKS
jgi:hypothetical protein